MSITGIAYLGAFAICSLGAAFVPMLGVCGYMTHYTLGQVYWWFQPLRGLGIRYSLVLAVATGLGIALNWRKRAFGKSAVARQEKLCLLLVGLVWLLVILGPETIGRDVVDHPSVKFTKIIVFGLMLSHIATSFRKVDQVLWVLVIGALILGLQAYDTPLRQFARGRIERVGGSDFREANGLAAYLVALFPFIAVKFLSSRWLGKALCTVAGAFAANTIVLTRSRGAFVGLAFGAVAAVIMAPKKYRVRILISLIVAGSGLYYLTDQQFRDRMSTITRSEDTRDSSAESRVAIWKGGLAMIADNPLGVGPGNFYQFIGKYARQHPGRDAHNTFIRCTAELGLLGMATVLMLLGSGVWSMRRLMKRAGRLPEPYKEQVVYTSYAIITSICSLVGCFMTMTLLYMEAVWWILLLPVCLQRAVENCHAQSVPSIGEAEPAVAGRKRPHRYGRTST